MKKISLSLLVLLAMLTAHSQTKTDSLPAKFKGNNELKLNLLSSVFGYPGIIYERILSKEFAIGLSVSIAIDKTIDIRSEFNPFIRFYVAGKKANGFFLEGNFIIANREDYSKHLYYEEILSSGATSSSPLSSGIRNSYGLAGGIGAKFLIGKGIVGELNFGIGELIGDFDEKRKKETGLAGINDIYLKGGISIGKRF